MSSERQRLDDALVAHGLAPSRARARDTVLRGCVRVNGQPARKPAQKVSTTDALTVDDPAGHYVSRSALKLAAALDQFAIDPAGRRCLDIGASTGGFTQVLLEREAEHVTALDVGHGQLNPRIAAEPRVTVMECINARHLTPDQLPHTPDLIVMDVSFISATLIIPALTTCAGQDTRAVILIKPQFELSAERLGRGGIVRAEEDRKEAIAHVRSAGVDAGWQVLGIMDAPIQGGDGNHEALIGLSRC